MELILERTELREDCTVGTLSVIKRVDDEYLAGETKDFLYDTLEPRVKELDAKGRYTITTPTAIPEGRYAVVPLVAPAAVGATIQGCTHPCGQDRQRHSCRRHPDRSLSPRWSHHQRS